MAQLRRSIRTRSKRKQLTVDSDSDSDSNISAIESDKVTTAISQNYNTENSKGENEDQEESTDDSLPELSSSSSEEEEDPNDSDYLEPSAARKRKRSTRSSSRSTNGDKPKNKKSSSQQPPVKKKKTNIKKTTTSNYNLPLTEEEQNDYLENVKAMEHSELFEALSESDDISIDEYLRGWLENYTTNRDLLLQDFVNFLLDCCGALVHVEQHDIHNNESATDTITEIQLLFEKQKVHEFHLMTSRINSKTSSYPNLYKNFVEFMSGFLDIANDMQLLYVESQEDNDELIMGPLVIDILTWLSAFSTTNVRCFRYIATLSLYLYQDFLTDHIVDLEKNYLAKFTKQLSLEKRKKRKNQTVIFKLENNIEEIQNSKIITENIIENIIKICFVHRFKDVDEIIRSESVLHLSTWIKNYPEYFMKVTYLKYFGWLLSDTSNIVRSQVLKVLPNIITFNHSKKTDNSAIRQFFERFRQRILDIALKDVDLEVRLYATNILTEIVSLGYLEDDEILAISSLIFDDNDVKVSAHNKNSRFLNSVSKFMTKIINEACTDFLKNNESLDENMAPIKLSALVKVGIFMRFISNSFLFYAQDNHDSSKLEKHHLLYQASEFLSPYFNNEIMTICKLLSDDNTYETIFNTIEQVSKDNKSTQSELEASNDTSITMFNTTPLLPTNNNNVILYLIVLDGLCHGASSIKNQQKANVVKSVLPHLLGLFKNLPIHSPDILPPLLNIFNLFTFEDWIQSENEKAILEITHIITKTIDECVLPSCAQSNIYYNALSNTLAHIENFKKRELDEVWLNEISHIKLHLMKFFSENAENLTDAKQFNDFISTVYCTYINKLVLIGKVYPVEFDHNLLVQLFDRIFSRFPEYYKQFDTEIIPQISFKLPVILVSWQIHKWAEISKKSLLLSNKEFTNENLNNNDIDNIRGNTTDDKESNNSYNNTSHGSIIKTLNTISAILDQFYSILITLRLNNSTNVHDLFKIKWELSNAIIDIFVAIICFELQLPEANRDWKTLIAEKFPTYLPKDIQEQLMETFLYLESLHANENEIQLEKINDENVILNDIHNSPYFKETEKELLVYLIKLKGLLRLGLISDSIITRLKLNENKFNSLYQSILNDEIFEDVLSNNVKTGTSHITSVHEDDSINEIPLHSDSRATTTELDPLEESSVSSTQENSKNHNTIESRQELDTIHEQSREESARKEIEESQEDPIEGNSDTEN
ncbi:cohesin subunit IRR1 PWA37_005337 [Arxiozyma heterogenica]|uniref:cohesin subunit IRR1 n=1 Tax=Arxiozyma heterogenica TaxID=278026 RepID=UPI002EFA8CBF